MRGSWRAKDRQAEPTPEKRVPRCPSWLRKEAKKAWRQLMPQLEAMGILGECDRNVLARYCQMWAKWRQAEEFIAKNGDIYPVRGALGAVTEFKQYPQVNTAIRLDGAMLRIEKEFGLTASARANLASPKEKDPHENRGKGRFFSDRVQDN